jgi:hypothetical protein
MPSTPATALTGFVRYRSAETEKGKLPVTIERKLYRLVAGSAPTARPPADQNTGRSGNARGTSANLAGDSVEFTLEPVTDSDIRSNELYLEEIRLAATGDAPRFGLLEVPLPPGADVERGTWGVRIKNLNGDGEVLPIELARSQPGELSYAVPVDQLSNGMVVRHLVRFGNKGNFVLPPARFYRMYQPDEKAFEGINERRVKVN